MSKQSCRELDRRKFRGPVGNFHNSAESARKPPPLLFRGKSGTSIGPLGKRNNVLTRTDDGPNETTARANGFRRQKGAGDDVSDVSIIHGGRRARAEERRNYTPPTRPFCNIITERRRVSSYTRARPVHSRAVIYRTTCRRNVFLKHLHARTRTYIRIAIYTRTHTHTHIYIISGAPRGRRKGPNSRFVVFFFIYSPRPTRERYDEKFPAPKKPRPDRFKSDLSSYDATTADTATARCSPR